MVVRTVELMDSLKADNLVGQSAWTLAGSKAALKAAQMAAMMVSN